MCTEIRSSVSDRRSPAKEQRNTEVDGAGVGMIDASAEEFSTLESIQRRVLWLAVRMIDHANNERPNVDGVKVGGHQASSASVVSMMTALFFHHLNGHDRVAVKPHAAPVFHAIQYLMGNLDRSYLTTLRSKGGLQSYPSRTKDPDSVDFSTGSVGLGPAAPLFAAATRRYVDAHFGNRPPARYIAMVGDAELDERQMRLTVRGVAVNLSPQEYRLVSYLMLHNGRVVSQQELAEHLQSVHFERESNAVEVLVARVRRKLPTALIETRRGYGYSVAKAHTE